MRQTTLIPMLGTNQCDELVLYPQATLQDDLPPIAGNGALQPFSKVRIEYNLDDVELNHSRDHEDDIFSVFSGEGLPADMTSWSLVEGEAKEILRLLCTVKLTIPQEKWGHALLVCNQFHGACRFGRCYLDITEGHPEARIFFESIVDLSDGVTDAYLQRFIMLSLYAAHVFFEKTRKENLFVPTRSKKRRRPHTTREVTHT